MSVSEGSLSGEELWEKRILSVTWETKRSPPEYRMPAIQRRLAPLGHVEHCARADP